MDHFYYKNHQLHAEQVPIADIVTRYGTPCYIYAKATLTHHWHVVDNAFKSQPHLICYAVKANSNLAILNLFVRLGSGFDVVSGGELTRVLKAGGKPSNIVFSGVGKSDEEIAQALQANISCLNVESKAELDHIAQVAKRLHCSAPIALRINPNIDPKTHPYIATGLQENKFGIDYRKAVEYYKMIQKQPHLNIIGIDCHIGSQVTHLEPFLEALHQLMILRAQLQQFHINIQHLNIGGGLGVRYKNESPPSPADYANAISERLNNASVKIILEPGRVITANAGILVTKVQYCKQTAHKHFAIVDAAMNDLLRPALYQAWHDVIPVDNSKLPHATSHTYDIVGPVCESGDFLAKDRLLALQEGDLLAIRSAGAYGFAMSSQYNSRPRAAEVMVDQDQFHLIRARETIEQLFQNEYQLPTA